MTVQRIYGNNRTFCYGRFIAGPDARSCIASFLMIFVPSIIWQFEVGSFFTERYNVIVQLFGVLIQCVSLGLLLMTALSDPGIMPRQKDYSDAYDPRTKTFRGKAPPRYYDLVLRGHAFKLKYCTTCNIYRPPRCTHCSVCENCIERFDHHCPWIGNCVGKRNYKLFFSFVSVTGALNALVLATSITQIVVLLKEYDGDGGTGLVETMRQEPLSTALVLYTAGIIWFTQGLCMYHSYLIITNQTTYEQIKGVYSAGNNPFHRGAVGNCMDILFSKVRPRYFNPYTMRLLWPKAPTDDPRDPKTGGFSDVSRELDQGGTGEDKLAEGKEIGGAGEAYLDWSRHSKPGVDMQTRKSGRKDKSSEGKVTGADGEVYNDLCANPYAYDEPQGPRGGGKATPDGSIRDARNGEPTAAEAAADNDSTCAQGGPDDNDSTRAQEGL